MKAQAKPEGKENRAKVLLTILEKPSLTFTELLEVTGLSRSTLSSHLEALEQENFVERKAQFETGQREKWTRKRRIVFRPIYDQNRLITELKALQFDFLVEMGHLPSLYGQLVEAQANAILKVLVTSFQRKNKGEPKLSTKDELVLIFKTLQANISPEISKVMGIDETLKGIKERSEFAPEFQRLDEIKSKMRARLEKNKGRHRQ